MGKCCICGTKISKFDVNKYVINEVGDIVSCSWCANYLRKIQWADSLGGFEKALGEWKQVVMEKNVSEDIYEEIEKEIMKWQKSIEEKERSKALLELEFFRK